ncbi:MAG: DUF1573 domain-containing protein [Verrucomicrobiota bacterium]|nr:DUF1573 domain-containing protein [Verrucomicrobiota bacterium]
MKFWVFLVLGITLFQISAWAQLKWETIEKTTRGSFDKPQAEASFRFRNTSPDVVEIESVDSTSPGTKGKILHSIIQPGDVGAIDVSMLMEDHTGLHSQNVFVTVKGREEPYVLTMKTYNPELARISRKSIKWRKNEPFAPRSFIINVRPTAEVQDVTFRNSNPNFSVRVKHVKENTFILEVAPPTKKDLATVNLEVHTQNNVERYQLVAEVE